MAVARLYQSIEYKKYSSDAYSPSELTFLVGGSYFPRQYFELGWDLSYEAYEPQGAKIITGGVTARLNFSRLSFETRYAYGFNKEDDGFIGDRKEHLFETKLKKTF